MPTAFSSTIFGKAIYPFSRELRDFELSKCWADLQCPIGIHLLQIHLQPDFLFSSACYLKVSTCRLPFGKLSFSFDGATWLAFPKISV